MLNAYSEDKDSVGGDIGVSSTPDPHNSTTVDSEMLIWQSTLEAEAVAKQSHPHSEGSPEYDSAIADYSDRYKKICELKQQLKSLSVGKE